MLGAVTMGNINTYYNVADIYGDASKLQVANFISSTTSPTAVIVAENTMARWLEGYGQRRVLLNLDPRFLFLSGELARDYAANEILFSDRGMRNGYAWVLDQAPYSQFSPLISLWIGGEYQQVAMLNDSASTVSWVNTLTGKNFTMPISNSTSTTAYWVANTTQKATIGATYHMGPVEVVREVSLSSSNGNVTFSFEANTTQRFVSITALTVSLGPLPSIGLSAAVLLANRTVRVSTTLGNLFFSSSSPQAFPFLFTPATRSNVVMGSASVWTDQGKNATGLDTYDRVTVAKVYGVTDVVVPRQSLVPVGQTENITLRALPLYENLMKDPDFEMVYYNDNAIVLQFVANS
jgi:hypothetical protein